MTGCLLTYRRCEPVSLLDKPHIRMNTDGSTGFSLWPRTELRDRGLIIIQRGDPSPIKQLALFAGYMAWIEVHEGLSMHRKTIQLAALLGVSRAATCGHLISFWLWALSNAPEGDLCGLDPSVVSVAAEWTGDPQQFMDGLLEVKFVDRTSEGTVIHDWYRYAGRLIERRRADRERHQSAEVRRNSAGNPQEILGIPALPYPNRTVPNQTLPTGNNSNELLPAISARESKKLPEWLQILSSEPRWDESHNEIAFIELVETEYGGRVNLSLEAHAAIDWLQTRKGQDRRRLKTFWLTWLKNTTQNGKSPVRGSPGDSSNAADADRSKFEADYAKRWAENG